MIKGNDGIALMCFESLFFFNRKIKLPEVRRAKKNDKGEEDKIKISKGTLCGSTIALV